MPARDHKGRFLKKGHIHHKYPFDGIFHLRGFSLLEIIIALAILTSISAGLFIAINPVTQLNKAQDAKRLSDLQEIRQALTVYYHDHNCYPAPVSPFTAVLNSGTEWSEAVGTKTVLYMKKVPKDPIGVPYIYTTDNTSCPQWNVVFAKLSRPQLASSLNPNAICPLPVASGCVPKGYDSSWACVTTGNTNCTALIAGTLSTPVPAPTSTPIPTPTPGGTGTFFVAMNSDPYFVSGTISPYPIGTGPQAFTINAVGTNPITSVNVKVNIDGTISNYTLRLTSGTANNGVWSGSWNAATIKSTYVITPTATDSTGATASTDIIMK